MVAEICAVPVFVAVNDAIFPDPLDARPIAVFEFVHVQDPPVGVVAKVVAGMTSDGTETVGVGFTVIV